MRFSLFKNRFGNGVIKCGMRVNASSPTNMYGSSMPVFVTAADCKKRWATVRDHFRKKHGEMTMTMSGQAATKKRKWYLYDFLTFLVPSCYQNHKRQWSAKRRERRIIRRRKRNKESDLFHSFSSYPKSSSESLLAIRKK
ncbi:hypothetical protein PoB_006442100 [Plakobranchus ocellatus]|uniref:MADF domain-containing protein n=1 Tax=Plakobranchus ocellatus TaxID=259542 RepID=A0AAV4D143_9GAST|nr:hypothetical protein PoB_006442100 [Plakobranchus ocellatus]